MSRTFFSTSRGLCTLPGLAAVSDLHVRLLENEKITYSVRGLPPMTWDTFCTRPLEHIDKISQNYLVSTYDIIFLAMVYLCVIFRPCGVWGRGLQANPLVLGVGSLPCPVKGPWMKCMRTWAACLSDGMPQRNTRCHAVYFNPVPLLSASAPLEPHNDA